MDYQTRLVYHESEMDPELSPVKHIRRLVSTLREHSMSVFYVVLIVTFP